MCKHNIIIVDPFSSGMHLAEEIKKRNWNCYALITLSDKLSLVEKYKECFLDIKLYQENIEELVKYYKTKNIDNVISGSESGVYITDILAEKLDLPGNSSNSSKFRRNKYQMQHALFQKGISCIQQFLVKTSKEAIEAAKQIQSSPVIVKPTESAGTDGVFFCYNEEEIINAFNEIYQQKNLYGYINNDVLIQEYIPGDEYIIDVVVQNGIMRTGGIFIYEKEPGPNGAPIYRSINLLPYFGKIQEKLINYAQKVVNALELTYGPAHIEIKMEKDKLNPVLIELGARMHGGYGPVFSRYGSGTSQIDLVLSLLSNVDFNSINEGYVLEKQAIELFIISKKEGKVSEWLIDSLLPTLESAKWWSIWAKENGTVKITKDLYSSPGVIVFTHEDNNILRKNLEKFLEKEKKDELFLLL